MTALNEPPTWIAESIWNGRHNYFLGEGIVILFVVFTVWFAVWFATWIDADPVTLHPL